jgi:hypothetical protein
MMLRLFLLLIFISGCALEVDNTQQDGGVDGQDGYGGDVGGDATGCQDECISGRRQCAAGGFQVCDDYDGDPCTEWSTVVLCAANEICDEGVCLGECADDCSRGQTRCGIGGVETCGDYDEDTCLEYGGWSACGEERFCEAGECVMDCSRQCSRGAQRCAASGAEGIETCGEYDGDACLEWGGLEPCAAGRVCDTAGPACLRPYPPGPYGTTVGEVLTNLCLEECICFPTISGKSFCMRDLLENKATLIAVHAGWCTACRAQTEDAAQLYQAYRAQGLGMVFVLFEDDREYGNRLALLNYGCWEKGRFGLSFMVAIDPGLQKMRSYFYEGAVPLNIIVDDDMVIRYVLEGYDPNSIEATIQQLLAE